MPEPPIEVIGNKASEQGAADQGYDLGEINVSPLSPIPEPLEVSLEHENGMTIVPTKPFGTIMELREGPTSILQGELTDDPQFSPPTKAELMTQFKVAVASMNRLLEVTERNPRESLIWFRIQPTMDVAVCGDRIIVLQDVTESVYSCLSCKGTGRSQHKCQMCMGEGQNCSHCMVVPFGHETPYSSGFKSCPDCNVKGKGVSFSNGWARGIVIPETALSLPVTGIVLSVGPDTCLTKLGDRVQFSRYAGHHTQMRGGRTFITMRESEVLCLLREANSGAVEAGTAG